MIGGKQDSSILQRQSMQNMLKDQKAEDMENRDNPLVKLHNEFNNI